MKQELNIGIGNTIKMIMQFTRMKQFYFANNKVLIKFFEWLYFPDDVYKIVKLKGFNVFLCDKKPGFGEGRVTLSPVWDKNRFVALYKRFIKKEKTNVLSNKKFQDSDRTSTY